MKVFLALYAVLFHHNIANTLCSADFLNIETFQNGIRPQFVLFYAPW